MAGTSTLSLDELVAVNEELAALVRAGVPLEATLGDMGRDMPGRLGRATTELAGRIERGASLSQALAAMPDAFPPMYRTAVEAGVRAGRLPVVLEDLAQAARRLGELRRVVAMAAFYPFVVLSLTLAFFTFFVTKIFPVLARAFEGHEPWLLRNLIKLGESAPTWSAVIPSALVLLAILAWYRVGRGRANLNWIPMIGPMLRDAHTASFAEILALLIDHDVPLAEALSLAASASGNKRLADSAQTVATQLQGGTVTLDPAAIELPQFFVWLITTGQRNASLVPLLHQTAEVYRRRALRRSDWIRQYLPILMTLLFGGVVVLLYALSLFLPLTNLLYDAASPYSLTR